MRDQRSPRVRRGSSDLSWGPAGEAAQIARLVTQAEHGASFVLGYTRLSPGGSLSFDLTTSAPPQQEAYLVDHGQITLAWADEEVTLHAGDSAFFPPGYAYTVRNDGGSEAIWTYVAVPAPH